MNKMLKVVESIIGAGAVGGLIYLLVFLTLILPKDESQRRDSIAIEVNKDDLVSISNKPDPVYAETEAEFTGH